MSEQSDFTLPEEIEEALQPIFPHRKPDQAFVDRLSHRLSDQVEQFNPPRRKVQIPVLPLAWGAIAIIFIVFLVWGIKTLIPRVEPSLSTKSTPSPTTMPTIAPTQAEGADEVINLPRLMGEPVPWPEEVITSSNAQKVTLLARWGKGRITGLAWSPDGKTLAISSFTGIYLHDAETLEEIRKIGNGSAFGPVVYSPDGSVLAGAEGTTIKLWDPASGRELHTLPGQTDWPTSLAFSPDGVLLASGYDPIIKLWDVVSGNEVAILKNPTENEMVGQLAFSTDGTLLISLAYPITIFPDGNRGTSGPATIRIWDVASRTELRTLPDCKGYLIALSPDNHSLAVLQENAIAFCDIESGAMLNKLEVNPGYFLEYSPDGKIIVGGVNNAIKFWDATTLEEIRTIGENLNMDLIAFSPDWKTIMVSIPADNAINLYDADNGARVGSLSWQSNSVTSMAISPDRSLVAAGSGNGSVKLLDAATGNELRNLTGHSSIVNNLAFSPDGATLASASNDKMVKLWDVGSGVELYSLDGVRMSLSGGTPSVAFTPDGKILAYAASSGRVILWDAINHLELRTLGGDITGEFADELVSITISPDGNTLASVYYGGSITLWNMTSGKELYTIDSQSSPATASRVTSLAFSPDGQMLVSGSSDNTVTMWDTASGSELRTIPVGAQIERLAFLPTGDVLVAGSRFGEIRLINASSGNRLNTLAGAAEGLAISADGTMIISASNDGVVKLWGIAPSNAIQGSTPSTPPEVEIVPTATLSLQVIPEDLGIEKIQLPIHLTGENLQAGTWSADGSYFYFSDQGPIGEPVPNQAINTVSFLEARTGKTCPSIQETLTFTQTEWGSNPIIPSLYERTTWLDDNRLLYINPSGGLETLTPCSDSIENWSTSLQDTPISFPYLPGLNTAQILLKGEQAYWILNPTTRQSVKLNLPIPPEDQTIYFAWSPGNETLIASRLEERQSVLWIILERIDTSTGAALPVYEVEASPDLQFMVPMGAIIEWVAKDKLLLFSTIIGYRLVDISSQPVQFTNLYPDLFKIDTPSEGATISDCEQGTGNQDYHLFVGMGMVPNGKFYLYHAESGLVDEFPFTTHILLVFPNGETVFAQNWVNEPSSADTVRVIYVDSSKEPHDLIVKGHTPRESAWLPEYVLPGAQQIVFSSNHGISLVDIESGTLLNFWELENQDQYQDFNTMVSPDGKTVIGFPYQKGGPGEGNSPRAMYWLRLEP